MKSFVVCALPFLAVLVAFQAGAEDAAGGSAPAASAPAVGVCEAQQALDRMDGRTPVPLLPMMANHQKQNMRDHLVAVQEIATAMAVEDYSAVETASRRIGYSDRMAQMCTHMGAGAPGFTEQALNFHRTADTITAAAQQKDMKAVAKALGATLQTCTGCHATFRQQVVDQAAWSRITSMPPPGARGPRGAGMGGRGPGPHRRCADPASADCPAMAPSDPAP
ncbi:MAG: cytochrome c [Candidatus Binatia bacterium]